jgi:hypothetical protein
MQEKTLNSAFVCFPQIGPTIFLCFITSSGLKCDSKKCAPLPAPIGDGWQWRLCLFPAFAVNPQSHASTADVALWCSEENFSSQAIQWPPPLTNETTVHFISHVVDHC